MIESKKFDFHSRRGKMRMSRRVGLVVLALALVFGLSWPAQAQFRVGLKLYGGYGYLAGGEGNEGAKGYADYWAQMAHVYGGMLISGQYNPFHYGLDAGGDLIFYFTPNIGIGFGGGYLQSSNNSTIHYSDISTSGNFLAKPQVSAIPIRASLVLSVPLSTSASLTFQGGLGYYLAKYKSVLRIEEGSDWIQFDQDAEGKGLGFHGGIGFELNFSPNFGLVLEGTARYAVIGNFEGTNTTSMSLGPSTSESGKLYYFKGFAAGLGTFPIVEVSDTAPSGPDVSDVHEAKIDFSGFAGRAGFIFRF
jgi:hypothetical protein